MSDRLSWGSFSLVAAPLEIEVIVNRFVALVVLGLVIALQFRSRVVAADDETGPVFQLRIYVMADGKLDVMNERFREHTTKLFERHGIENVGYWVATDKPHSENMLIYLLKHKSREAADASWAAFGKDSEWQAIAKATKDQHGNILKEKIDATYMVTTDYSPEVQPPRADKLYELRVYKANEGKLDALHARFRDHTQDIFASHNMRSYGYWSPTEGTKAGNNLIYILEYDDRDAANAGWQAFFKDPKWQKAYQESIKDGRLLAEKPESIYMRPTNYSPIRE
ncbi:MAG: NIPSNAP family protein [Planctomycetaceae bacterium]|nr:NIPSNAP family protein [Planctomycetaceae bacterium]